jgi:D-alanyl-lipoteichoic acid acyltransferase DltB (MBOAT superfamily)
MYWNPYYIILILFSTLSDFIIAQNIEQVSSKTSKSALLGISIFLNLGMLFIFKYYDFIVFSFSGNDAYLLNLLLPVGISFYTFQTMSYSIDVYRGEIEAEKTL